MVLKKDIKKILVKKDNTRVLLLDLAAGKWSAGNGKNKFEFFVSKDEGNYYAILSQGSWKIMPCKK